MACAASTRELGAKLRGLDQPLSIVTAIISSSMMVVFITTIIMVVVIMIIMTGFILSGRIGIDNHPAQSVEIFDPDKPVLRVRGKLGKKEWLALVEVIDYVRAAAKNFEDAFA